MKRCQENENKTIVEKARYGKSNEFDYKCVLASDNYIPMDPRYQLLNCAQFDRNSFIPVLKRRIENCCFARNLQIQENRYILIILLEHSSCLGAAEGKAQLCHQTVHVELLRQQYRAEARIKP